MKYAGLGDYLDSLETDEKYLSLEQIGRLIDGKLPKFARSRSFWNNARSGRAQAGPGWMNVGWRVKRVKKLGKEVVGVTFHRPPSKVDPSIGPKIGIVSVTEEERAQMRRVPLHSIHAFRETADYRLGDEFGQVLPQGYVPHINHRFDFVSPNKEYVGEARLYRNGRKVHTATYASISEAVFLLSHVKARGKRFIVFGGDRQVPLSWLDRHGNLAGDVAFYFLHESGDVELLQDSPLVREVPR